MHQNVPTPRQFPSRHTRTSRWMRAGILCIAAGLTTHAAQSLAASQKTFPSADEAAQALVAAVKAGDMNTTLAVLGPSAKPILQSGDPISDRESRERFVTTYDQAHSVKTSDDGTRAVLQIGTDEWPFPIPVVKTDAGWRFDTDAGKEEIIDRRIGRNERWTIQSCLAYVDAQREYYQRNPEHSPLLHYAQRVASSKGKRDGLYWPTGENEEPSPLGALFAQARAEGYSGKGGQAAYHGYSYRPLTAQGPNAKGGAYSYVAHGKLMGGFALVASPAQYGVSGVMTFLVNHDGIVFEKDLGPNTAAIAKAMKTFDPDSTWKQVEETEMASPS